MSRTFRPVFTLLLFGASLATRAQTVALAPVAIGSSSYSFTTTSSTPWSFVDGIRSSYARERYRFGLGYRIRTIEGRWKAEFDVSSIPEDVNIVSATLSSSISSAERTAPAPQRFSLYVGDGKIAPTDGESRGLGSGTWIDGGADPTRVPDLDVSAALRTSIAARERYVGVEVTTTIAGTAVCSATTVWGAPTLTIVYAPKVSTFASIGALGGTDRYSSARALSADGNTVVGVSDTEEGDRAFVWNVGQGLRGLDPGTAIASGVTDAEIVVIGTTAGGTSFRKIVGSPATEFGPNAIAGGVAAGSMPVSSGFVTTGGCVVGSALAPNGERQVYRWEWARTYGAPTSVSRFPTYIGAKTVPAHAVASSYNGEVFVGSTLTTPPRAFVWKKTGEQFALPILPGGTGASEALAVAEHGRAVVGWSRGARGPEAFRWTAAGMLGLGNLKNPDGTLGNASRANAISPDGTLVVGAGVSGGRNRAFIWDGVYGIQNLQTLLVGYGAGSALEGWTLFDATGVTRTSDGTIVVTGTGFDPRGRARAFYATLPRLKPPTAGSALRP